jgi:hypothetical protein
METLVERRLLDMSLTQLELRCVNNTVHYVLNKEDSKDPLLTSNEVRQLLSKTPKFLPTPKYLQPKNVMKDCDLFGFRLIKTFNRFVCKDYISKAHANAKSAGIVNWKPNQFPYSMDYYAEYTNSFFEVTKPSGTVWKSNQKACPRLQQFIESFKKETTDKAVEIARRGIRVKSNLPHHERLLFRNVQARNVGYNISDKNYGPVLYSRDLYMEQCRKLLFDEQGTYEYTEQPKDLILSSLVRRLKNLVNDCLGTESATQALARTLTKWADESLKRGRLCKFYVIWKLHKAANAQGVRSRPIASNIGYPTGQISQFLHSQLIDAVNRHDHVLKDSLSLIRLLEATPLSLDQNIFLTSADVAALYPSINIDDGMKALQWFMAQHTSIPQEL